MNFTQQERRRIMAWRIKLALMVDQAYLAEPHKSEKYTAALHIAMLEMAIAGMRTIEDQTGTMTVLNQVMYDIFDAEDDPDHWRQRENADLIDLYAKVMREYRNQTG